MFVCKACKTIVFVPVFALASLLLLRLHLLPLLLPCPESVGVIILCVCPLCVLLNSHS